MLRVKSLTLPNKKKVNFNLAAQESVVITGQNGVGKSLFLKSLAFLNQLDFEEFTFQGQDVLSYKIEDYRSQVLYVSTSHMMMKDGTVEDFFKSVLRYEVYKDHVFNFNYSYYLDKWNLSQKELIYLSSGQKQMISILRALSLKAKVLLLDEPTANLDEEKTIEVEKLFSEWRAKTGGSLVIVAHGRDQIKRLGINELVFDKLLE